MGSYHFVLAALVVVSHAEFTLLGHNVGVAAVIGFYVTSGFVMTALIERHYPGKRFVPLFYVDRAARIYPQFLLYAGLTLLLIGTAGRPDSPFLADVTPLKVVLNLLILPLGFFMLGLSDALLLPPTWSLGLELMFYLAIPWIIAYRASSPLFIGSAAIFLAAYLGLLNTDDFGYRLLPGTLFMFLCGRLIYRSRAGTPDAALVAVWVGAVALFVATWAEPSLHRPYSREVLAGLIASLPAVWFLRGRDASGALDRWLGNVSYGMFLNHFLLLWLCQLAFGWRAIDGGRLVILLITSALLAALSFLLVEQPALRFRRRFRQRAGAAIASA